MIETARLDQLKDIPNEQQVLKVREWWEETGSRQAWTQ